MRRVVDSNYGYTIEFTVYSRAEIEAAWTLTGDGHEEAKAMKRSCVLVRGVDKEQALRISAMFVRCVCALPTCAYYDEATKTVSLYCGRMAHQMLSHTLARTENLVHMLLGGEDLPFKGAPLFEDDIPDLIEA
jgi:hypothetical protein